MTVHVEPHAPIAGETCAHPRCDGRLPRWRFPQTAHLPRGPLKSCSVHLARITESVIDLLEKAARG